MRPLLALATALLLAVPAAAAANVVPATTVAGPSDKLTGTISFDVAPDGTAAVGFLLDGHATVARYANGAWSPAERVDTGLAGASSSVSVTVSPGGRVVAAFLNGQRALSRVSPASGQPFTAADIQLDPAHNAVEVDAAEDGTTYAVTSTTGGQSDVRAYRLNGTTWQSVGPAFPDPAGALDADQAKDAGPAGQEGPVLTALRGGGAVVAWGEDEGVSAFRMWARRIDGLTAGPARKASPDALDGAPSAKFALLPDLDADAAGRAWLAFRDDFVYGATNRARILVRSVDPGGLGDPAVVDGLGASPTEGSEFPRVDVNAKGDGLLATPRQLSNQSWAATLTGGAWSPGFRMDVTGSDSVTGAWSALGDDGTGAVAWVRDPGGGGARQALARRRPAGGAFGPELPLADTALGSVEGQSVRAGAMTDGSVLVAFTQLAGAQRRVAVARLDGPPPPAAPAGGGGSTPGGDGGTTPTETPGGGTTTTTPPPVQRFGARTRVTLTVPVRARGGVLSVRVRNANAFTVRAALELRVAGRRLRATKAVRAGATATLRVKLPRAIRNRLRRGRLTAKATLTVRDPAGTARRVRATVRLRR